MIMHDEHLSVISYSAWKSLELHLTRMVVVFSEGQSGTTKG